MKSKKEFLKKIQGAQTTQIVATTARLKIADSLPASAEEIAKTKNLALDPLKRLLRALLALRLIEKKEDLYHLTEEGEYLKGDLGDIAAFKGSPAIWRALEKLSEGIQTGKSPFELAHNTSLFPYLDAHPDERELFQNAMAAYVRQSSKVILDLYDFSECKKILDVGGGDGTFLQEILSRHPHLEGSVFEREGVNPNAIVGNFFISITQGFDTLLFRNIFHDWDDESCRKILQNCNADRLLIFETLLSSTHLGTFADLNMFVTTPGGKERTEEEFRTLLSACGFHLQEVLRSTASKALLIVTKN